MNKKKKPTTTVAQRRYQPPDVPLAIIRRYARQIVERFEPDRIILFGSFAYGQPNADSDADLLVVMPAANEITQAVRIRLALQAPFPLDLIVRTPKKIEQRLQEGSWFLREIVEKGKVLYEKRNSKVAAKRQATRESLPVAEAVRLRLRRSLAEPSWRS